MYEMVYYVTVNYVMVNYVMVKIFYFTQSLFFKNVRSIRVDLALE